MIIRIDWRNPRVMPEDRASLIIRPQDLHLYRSARPCTASEALAAVPSAFVVLDGVMFSNCDPAARGYGDSRCGDPTYLLLDRSTGLHEPSERADVGMTISIVGCRAVAKPGAAVATGASVAVQGYPTLVRDGVARRFSDDASMRTTWRAGFGITRSGHVVLAIAYMQLGEFAEWARSIGATDFVYSDGGGSGRMQWRDGRWVGSTEDRRVPSFLVWGVTSPDRATFALAAALAALGIAIVAASE